MKVKSFSEFSFEEAREALDLARVLKITDPAIVKMAFIKWAKEQRK